MAGVRQVADTLVGVDEIDARAAVAARVDGTVVDVSLAVGTHVARQALTHVAVQLVNTLAAVLARVAATLVYVELTSLPCNKEMIT